MVFWKWQPIFVRMACKLYSVYISLVPTFYPFWQLPPCLWFNLMKYTFEMKSGRFKSLFCLFVYSYQSTSAWVSDMDIYLWCSVLEESSCMTLKFFETGWRCLDNFVNTVHKEKRCCTFFLNIQTSKNRTAWCCNLYEEVKNILEMFIKVFSLNFCSPMRYQSKICLYKGWKKRQ